MATPPALWPALLSQVDATNGVAKVKMSVLRELEGAQRMGPNVAESVHNRLLTLGLWHLPEDLNIRQDSDVLLIKLGTPAAEVIHTFVNYLRGNYEVSDQAVSLMGRLNSMPPPEEVVRRSELRESVQALLHTTTELLGMTNPASSEDGHVPPPTALPTPPRSSPLALDSA